MQNNNRKKKQDHPVADHLEDFEVNLKVLHLQQMGCPAGIPEFYHDHCRLGLNERVKISELHRND